MTVPRRLITRPMVEANRLEVPSITLGPGLRLSRWAIAVATTSSGLRIRAPAVASSVPTTALNSVLVAPGESAKTVTPDARVSAQTATEDFTDGLVLRDVAGHAQWLCGLYAVDALRGAVSLSRSEGTLDSSPVRALFSTLALTWLDDPHGLSADIDTPAV